MADPIELALAELENEPLPTHTRDHPPPDEDIQVEYAEEGLEARQNAPQEVEKREIPAEEGIEELRARLQGAETARRQAEDRANQAEQARAAAAGAAQNSDVQFLSTALEGVKQSMGILEANLAEAYAVQDFAGAARIQTEISRTALRESQIETGLEHLKTAPREQPRAAPPPDDPVERVARDLTPNAAAWVRAHPDFVTDPKKNQQLVASHYLAMAEGLTPDSHEYVRWVENYLLGPQQRREPEPRSYERRDSVAETRRSAPPAAPVSRGNGGASNPTRVTLTEEQRNTAHDNFPDEMRDDPSGRKAEQAYARNMLILRREKRMN